jgi:hypothetical protein
MSIFESIFARAAFAGLILSLASAMPALASAAKKSEPAPGSSVEMPYLIAPLNDGDTLVAYAYISCKIIASSPNFAVDIRDKVPFIQDAFVRDVNATNIGKADAPQTVDNTALAARLLTDVRKVMKPGSVADVQLIEVQIRPLHPQPINPGGPS